MTPPDDDELPVPEGWATAQFANGLIADIQTGFACGVTNRDGDGVPHLRPMNVSTNGDIELSDLKFVPATEVDRDERWLTKGDVLFNNTNSPELVGKTAYYGERTPRAFSNHMTRLRCRTDALDPKFCAFVLHQKWRAGHFEAVCNNHVSQASISRGVLLETVFLLPPLDEQRRIVAKVESLLMRVDATRNRLLRVPSLLKKFRRAVLTAAFAGELSVEWRDNAPEGESAQESLRRLRNADDHPAEEPAPHDLPSSWKWTTIGDCFEVSVGGTPSRKAPEFWDGDIPWVSSGEVQFTRIRNTRERITRLGLENSNTKLNPVGTVLVGMIGEGKTRGQAAILDIEACNNQNAAAIRVSLTPIPSEFVFYWLWSQYEATRERGAGNSQPALNKARIERIPMPFPPLKEQAEIVRRITAMFKLADAIEHRVSAATMRTEKLAQSILTKAFRGELVSTEAELARSEGRTYETASELLERVRGTPSSPSTKKRKPTSRKGTMTKLNKESVKAAVAEMPARQFSFEELREKLPGDYDALKDIIFSLLDESQSGIEQTFDTKTKAIMFRRTVS